MLDSDRGAGVDTSCREMKEAWLYSILCSRDFEGTIHSIKRIPHQIVAQVQILILMKSSLLELLMSSTKLIDGKPRPRLSVSTRKTHAWTPIAARTRARMANIYLARLHARSSICYSFLCHETLECYRKKKEKKQEAKPSGLNAHFEMKLAMQFIQFK